MQSKKTKAKIIIKAINKNDEKDHESIIEVFLKMRTFKKEVMLTLEINICQTPIEKEKRKCVKNYFHRKKPFKIILLIMLKN